MIYQKTIVLTSGYEEGCIWDIEVRVLPNGSFKNKGAFSYNLKEPNLARIRRWNKKNPKETYWKKIKTSGICLFCGDIDWRHLEEHHPDKEKMADLTVTVCANCHRELHPERHGIGGALSL